MFNVSSKLRPSIDSTTPRHGSPGTPATNASKPNSLSLPRETIVIPEREPNETPAKYLARLQEAVNRDAIAGILARSDDAFSHSVLRSYMRSFAFFEDPIDMAIRKLLMKVELPKETQQIDRVLQKFADRYHECNPGIFSSAG
jgi:Sec7-like guanine-nucleotide exchange factor